jgi:hypothetical protein
MDRSDHMHSNNHSSRNNFWKMTNEKIETAKQEALRFLKRVEELEKEWQPSTYYTACKESGAVKRASMDLTRALAELRKPD